MVNMLTHAICVRAFPAKKRKKQDATPTSVVSKFTSGVASMANVVGTHAGILSEDAAKQPDWELIKTGELIDQYCIEAQTEFAISLPDPVPKRLLLEVDLSGTVLSKALG